MTMDVRKSSGLKHGSLIGHDSEDTAEKRGQDQDSCNVQGNMA